MGLSGRACRDRSWTGRSPGPSRRIAHRGRRRPPGRPAGSSADRSAPAARGAPAGPPGAGVHAAVVRTRGAVPSRAAGPPSLGVPRVWASSGAWATAGERATVGERGVPLRGLPAPGPRRSEGRRPGLGSRSPRRARRRAPSAGRPPISSPRGRPRPPRPGSSLWFGFGFHAPAQLCWLGGDPRAPTGGECPARVSRHGPGLDRPGLDRPGPVGLPPVPAQSPVAPSIRSRRRSACPLWRAYSSIMCR